MNLFITKVASKLGNFSFGAKFEAVRGASCLEQLKYRIKCQVS